MGGEPGKPDKTSAFSTEKGGGREEPALGSVTSEVLSQKGQVPLQGLEGRPRAESDSSPWGNPVSIPVENQRMSECV